MNTPLIGITPSHDPKASALNLRFNYCNAIRQAGGIPVILPLELSEEEAATVAEKFDGLLLSGGPDIHPFLFGEETLKGCGDVSFLRDSVEIALFHHMYNRRKPVLGICRGAQLMNIALGGDIYQDINSQLQGEPRIAHIQPFHYSAASHHVSVAEGSLLRRITGSDTIEVNSAHHQAVRNTAPGALVSARSADGLTEALELPGYPFLLGVQWHPEYLYENYAHARSLFQAFVQACPQND